MRSGHGLYFGKFKLIYFSIKYESDKKTFWVCLCGEMNEATIKVNLIDIETSYMSFSVNVKETNIEYCGKGLNGIFSNTTSS